jgi:hypothetical protein
MLVDPRNGVAVTRIANFGGDANGFLAQIQNGVEQFQQALQNSAQPPAAPMPTAQPPPVSVPSLTQPTPGAPAPAGPTAFPTSLPTPEELMRRQQPAATAQQ